MGVFTRHRSGPRNLIATVMFVVFAATDWLDGFLARKLNKPRRLVRFWIGR